MAPRNQDNDAFLLPYSTLHFNEKESVAKVAPVDSGAWMDSFWAAMSERKEEWRPPTSTSKSKTVSKLEPTPPLIHFVRFDDFMEVWEIPAMNGLTDKQKQQLWHPEPDRKAPKRKATPLHLLRCQKVGTTKSCLPKLYRGDNRNDHDDDDIEIDDEQIKYSIETVLEEQRFQKKGEECDVEMISKLYRQCTANSSLTAQTRATMLELEVVDYY